MILQGQVGPIPNPALQDGLQPNILLGRSGEVIVAELHGKYYTQTSRGNVFIGSTATAGVTLPVVSNTVQTFGLWNPLGSGKNAVLIKSQIGWVSGPGAPGNFVYGFQLNVGSQIGTGAAITGYTTTAPVNGLLGSGLATVMKFGAVAAAFTLTTAPTLLRTMGVSQLTTTAATTTAPWWMAFEDFDGTLIIPPGVIFTIAGNVAPTTVADVALTWAEVPV